MLVVNKAFKNFCDRISDNNKVGKFLKFIDFESNTSLIDISEINHLSMGSNGMLEYSLTHKDLVLDENFNWTQANRQQGKPSKIIRKIIRKECLHIFTEKDFEDFANLYKSKGLDVNYEFQIVKGIDIHNTYMMGGTKNNGTLGSSCMRKEIPMFGLYVDNTDIVSLIRLIDKSTNKLAGRAILWTFPNGETFMDRVYTVDDFLVELFFEFAKENNITYRKYTQSHSTYEDFYDIKSGMKVSKKVEIQLNTDFKYSPYLDTFRYGIRGEIRNYQKEDNVYEFRGTSGTRSSNSNISDTTFGTYETGNNIEEDLVTVTAGEYTDYVFERHLTCYIDGDIYHIEDDEIVHSDVESRYLIRDYSTWCDDIEDYVSEDTEVYHIENRNLVYYHDDDLIYIDGSGYFMEEDAVEIDGDFYENDSDKIVQNIDGYYILKETAVEIEGDFYEEDDYRVITDIDGEYILRDDSIMVEGDYYHTDDSRITINELGETILIQE